MLGQIQSRKEFRAAEYAALGVKYVIFCCFLFLTKPQLNYFDKIHIILFIIKFERKEVNQSETFFQLI